MPVLDELTADLPPLASARPELFRRATDDFFAAMIGNDHTRRAYLRAVRDFARWAEAAALGWHQITAGDVARYLRALDCSVPTRKLRLAALRRYFDHLVVSHVMPGNPASPVKLERYSQDEGKTVEITAEEVRRLLSAIDTSSLLGLRDRAVIGVLNFTGARVGAVTRLQLTDLVQDGTTPVLRFREKNGKQRVVPVRAELIEWLNAYLEAAGLSSIERERSAIALFQPIHRSVATGTQVPAGRSLESEFIRRMLKRRCKAAGLSPLITPHSFRVKTVTVLLVEGHPLEDVQYLVGHADPRTTRLYDRRKKAVSRGLVDSIPI
ncbi:MAG: tyrosine-type recombinase/integrase [Fimbriiglobus sp.]